MAGRCSSGGSAQLAVLIDKYGEILVPELNHYFGIDLRALFSEVDPLSPRWVLAHVKNLPMDSAFVAEQRGGQHFRGWDEGRYMMASLINLIRASNYLFVLANTDPKKHKQPPPESYPIPDTKSADGKTVKPKKVDKPGSFAFIAKSYIAAARKQKEVGG